jgi:hypothetical protein
MNSWMVGGVGLSLAAALAFWAGHRVDASGKGQRVQPAAAPAAPTERIVVVRTIAHETNSNEGGAKPPSAPADDDAEPERPTRRDYERMSSEEIAAFEKQDQRTRNELLDRRFDGQATDRNWSYATEQQLTTAIRGIPPINDVRLASVQCRSDMCKTTLEHPDAQPVGDFIQAFVMSGMSHLEHHFRYEEGRVLIYSLRSPSKGPEANR